MRKITEIIVHCTATPEGKNISIDDIRRCHIQQNGWKDIGYHYVITLDGQIHPGRNEDDIGAHCKGHNANSIGVAFVGGLDADGKTPKDTRNAAQKTAMLRLLKRLKEKHPGAIIHSHCDFAAKACPCFNATKEYALITVFLLFSLFFTSCGSKKTAIKEDYAAEKQVQKSAIIQVQDSIITNSILTADSITLVCHIDSIPVKITAHKPAIRTKSQKTTSSKAVQNQTSTETINEASSVQEEKQPAKQFSGIFLFLMLLAAALVGATLISKKSNE